jgi:hypothetical protein
VWDLQLRAGDDRVAVEDDVEVDRPRAPPSPGQVAAQLVLDLDTTPATSREKERARAFKRDSEAAPHPLPTAGGSTPHTNPCACRCNERPTPEKTDRHTTDR